jgi:hypothetical protein
MPGIGLTDIEQLPDPRAGCTYALNTFGISGFYVGGTKDAVQFTQGNNWSKAKLDRTVAYAINEGWAAKEGGMLQITEAGRTKIGK